MSNYPDGMTTADWAHLDGGPECPECGAEQNSNDLDCEVCWNCKNGEEPDDD